jgi:hypothetical protein
MEIAMPRKAKEIDINAPTMQPPVVAPLDFTKPIFILVEQTPSRVTYHLVTGDTVILAQTEANVRADAISIATGRPVAVIGPQTRVSVKPERAADMKLGFGE